MQKSLILVTVDCLRADHVGFMGYDRPTTPFLDSLAHDNDSLVFPAAIVAGAPTYYSFPAIMASRFPLALGRDLIGIAPSEPTLAAVLKQTGYATAAFSAANPYISSRFGYQQGFDTFRDFLDDGSTASSDTNQEFSNGNGWAAKLNQKLQQSSSGNKSLSTIYNEIYFEYCLRLASPEVKSLDTLRRFPAANVIVDQARSWLASIGDAPFFLWLHLMDPHGPYYPVEKAVELMGQRPVSPSRARYVNSFWNRSDVGPNRLARHREEIVALYDSGIRWVDTQMSRLIDELKNLKRWENCIFALTADHGEEFLDHGGRFHSPSRLMEELIHVPLLLRVPGVSGKNTSPSPFSMLHLAPTLLDAAEVPIPQDFCGSSQWEQINHGANWDEVVIAECVSGCTNPFRPQDRMGPRVLAVRESRYKLVLHFDRRAEQLFDLEADPGEHSPLPDTAEKSVRRRLLERAQQHLQHSIADRDSGRRLQARLREFRLEWLNSLRSKSGTKASPVAS